MSERQILWLVVALIAVAIAIWGIAIRMNNRSPAPRYLAAVLFSFATAAVFVLRMYIWAGIFFFFVALIFFFGRLYSRFDVSRRQSNPPQ